MIFWVSALDSVHLNHLQSHFLVVCSLSLCFPILYKIASRGDLSFSYQFGVFFNYLIRSFSGGLLEMCFFSFSASLLFFLSLSGLFQEGLWGGSGRWSSGCSQVNLQKHSDPLKTVIWTVLGKFSVALCSSLRQCTAVGRGYPIPPARIFGETLDILHFFAIVFGFLCDFWIALMHSLIIATLRGSHGLSARRAWRTL